jgi:hypothetical protein
MAAKSIGTFKDLIEHSRTSLRHNGKLDQCDFTGCVASVSFCSESFSE